MVFSTLCAIAFEFPEAVAALSGSPITQQKAPADNQRHISEPQKSEDAEVAD